MMQWNLPNSDTLGIEVFLLHIVSDSVPISGVVKETKCSVYRSVMIDGFHAHNSSLEGAVKLKSAPFCSF